MFNKILYPFKILAYVIVVAYYTADIFVSMMLAGLLYLFKFYKKVMVVAQHISNTLEDLNDLISGLCFKSDELLSKKKNNLKSKS